MGQFESFIGVDFWTALFVLLNTLAIFFVARKFLFRPVHDLIESRQKEINGMYDDADKAKGKAEALQAEYEEKLSQARMTSEKMMQDAVARSRRREEEIVTEANAKASAIMTKAENDAALEKKRVLNDAKDEIAGMAMAIAGKAVGRELTGKDQTALVDNFIDELGDKA